VARPRTVTDEQIVEATRSAVLEKGAQVSLDSVAKQIGVTSPALLKRFGTRENLLIAALIPDLAELDALFEEPGEVTTFVDDLEALIGRLSQYFARVLPWVMALRECGVSDDLIHQKIKLPLPVRAVEQMTRWLRGRRKRGLIDSDLLETAATAIVGAVTTRMVSAHLSKRPWSKSSQKKHQRELAVLFAAALDARSRGRRKP
jgi:AcrR family transcriptional regulator